MSENEKKSKYKWRTDEKIILFVTLIMFAISFIIAAINSPKVSGEVIYTSSQDQQEQLALYDTEDYYDDEFYDPYLISAPEKVKTDESVGDKININTATSSELQKLDGIGEVKAEAIIEYRNKYGKFKTIEDIKKVSGIGDKTFEKIKDKITV